MLLSQEAQTATMKAEAYASRVIADLADTTELAEWKTQEIDEAMDILSKVCKIRYKMHMHGNPTDNPGHAYGRVK